MVGVPKAKVGVGCAGVRRVRVAVARGTTVAVSSGEAEAEVGTAVGVGVSKQFAKTKLEASKADNTGASVLVLAFISELYEPSTNYSTAMVFIPAPKRGSGGLSGSGWSR